MIGTAAALVGSALIGGAATVYGASQNASAIKKGAKAQRRAEERALEIQQQNRAEDIARQKPWYDIGVKALERLSAVQGFDGKPPDYSAFQADPGYQFRVNEGLRAISGNASARGLLDAGATGKALLNYGQEAGSAEFANWYNRLAALAGVGQTTAQGLSAGGQAYANNVTGILQQGAANRASSYQAQAANNAGLASGLAGLGVGLLQNWPGAGGAGASTGSGMVGGLFAPTI